LLQNKKNPNELKKTASLPEQAMGVIAAMPP
jgi:hypothetical protein